MLHTRTDNYSLALWVRQFEPECLNCVGLKASGLCAGCPHRSPALVVKLAERITGEMLNNFNIKQYGKYRTREYPRGTARE